jgi:tRNA dimethylallyltransferase
MPRPRLLALVGPTAAGKTTLAIGLAESIGAEVVSIDSRQVFRGLDVGTAKPTREERARVPHHLLDVVDPAGLWDAARHAEAAARAIGDVERRGRVALLCGGSGLYLRALADGLCPAPPRDPALRDRLLEEIAEGGADRLRRELEAGDPDAAGRIAPRDFARLVRAIEVLRLTGRAISAWQAEHRAAERPFDVAVFVLSPPVEELDRRIACRTAEMFASGLLEETRAALDAGAPADSAALRSIGYREAQLVLAGTLGLPEAVAAATLATRRYAKRQRTWFRGLPGARWLDPADAGADLRQSVEAVLAGGLHAA